MMRGRTIVKTDTMNLKEFMHKQPNAVSKVKFAQMIGAKAVHSGMGVLYFEW